MGEQQVPIPTKRLSEQELSELTYRSAQGDAYAREQLVSAHLYLVDQLVRQHYEQGVDYDDLFQEGCYGLLLAVDKYDESKGTSLSTYAIFWINKYIKRCLHQQRISSPILPEERVYYQTQRYYRTMQDLYKLLGRQPTDEELAARMEISVPELRKLQLNLHQFISLDAEIEKEDAADSTPSIFITSNERHCASAETEVLSHLPEISLYGVCLTKREEMVLLRHLGFTSLDGEPESFRMISADTGLSIESLRRAYCSAIAKIQEAAHAVH